MRLTESRTQYRALLEAAQPVELAAVFDVMSARIAQSLGYRAGLLGGSVVSALELGAPDLVVITLTELAGQVRRICRGASLPLSVDVDHGYGNALNAMRTVEELEHAGASAITLEDTLLPAPYGAKGKSLIPQDEMLGKLRAALAARRDSSFAVLARTLCTLHDGADALGRRAAAYAAAGVDGLFLVQPGARAEIEAVRSVTRLPIVLAGPSQEIDDPVFLKAQKICMTSHGNQPLYAAVQAVHDALKHLRDGGSPAALRERLASGELLDVALRRPDYRRWQREYLNSEAGE